LEAEPLQVFAAIVNKAGSNKAANQSYPGYLELSDRKRNRSFDGLVALNVVAAGLNKGRRSS